MLQRLAEGDVSAYRALYEFYWDQVYGTAFHLTKSPEQSKDLAQDIFFKLWTNRERLAGVNELRNYLFIVSRNAVWDYLRTQVFRESNRGFLEQYMTYTQASPQEIVEQKELDGAALAAIDRLPPQLRQVFRLSRIEGLTHEEIARRMNITPLSSKTYMVRALAFLREELGRNGPKLLVLWTMSHL
ncbi:RNA polymerase sigma factor [Dinghuibacter silviterrae]|uniref:RNA polymerase sigma factor n=1 Tax=Dinghuibacter silviterrae TaxID=1539049 RepID=UPI0013C2CD54|nr:RNA polymerase sigma-70 factor [Dinghuibacter silviterrae]